MTYRENSNTNLASSHIFCSPLTIRGWVDDSWYGQCELDDTREMKSLSLSGNALKIYSQYHQAGYNIDIQGAVRSGKYIYLQDFSRTPEYDWWYYVDHQTECNNSYVWHSHVIEINLQTGDVIDMDIGSPGGHTSCGSYGQLSIVGERKIAYYDYWLDQTTMPTRRGNTIRIIDFAAQTVDESIYIDRVQGNYLFGIWQMCAIKDTNDEVHLLVFGTWSDNTIEWMEEWPYDRYPNSAGWLLYEKNCTTDAAWQRFDIPLNTQDDDISAWSKYFGISNNRYLVIYGSRIGNTEGEEYGDELTPAYLTHIVYDVLNPTQPPVLYELRSPWGDSWWDVPTIGGSAPDVDGMLYEVLYQYAFVDDIRTLKFNPATGVFTPGTFTSTYPDEMIALSSREHAYFWSATSHNFVLASTEQVLGNYEIDLVAQDLTPPDTAHSMQNFSNILDSNGGGAPMVWFWNYDTSKLIGVTVEGTVVHNKTIDGFTDLGGDFIRLRNMGDFILLMTRNQLLYPHGDPPNTWNVGCNLVDIYRVT